MLQAVCVTLHLHSSPVALTLDGVKVPKNVGLVQWGNGHHDKVPEEKDATEPLVHLPVVGVSGPDEEHDGGEQGEGGVEDALVQHLHPRAGGDHAGLQEPGESWDDDEFIILLTSRLARGI